MDVNVREAKPRLADLIKRALNGEEIVITTRGVGDVKLVPVTPAHKFAQGYGMFKDLVAKLPAGWDSQEANEQADAEVYALFKDLE